MTVRINKDAINLREKLSQLDKPSGLVGEELLRADTPADAREALNLEEHLFEDFESTGIDDNATSTKVTVSDSGVDVDGTVTADGLTVDGDGYFGGTTVDATDYPLRIQNKHTGASAGVGLEFSIDGVNDVIGSTIRSDRTGASYHQSAMTIATRRADGSGLIDALKVDQNGDVHFYEDTGTTAKFVWDASAETLNVDGRIKTGTTSDGVSIGSNTGKGEVLGVDTAGNGWNALDIRAGALTQLYLNTDGNVGIGTSTPYGNIHLSGGQQDIVLTNENADGVAGATIGRFIGQARGWQNEGDEMASIDFETNSTSWFKGDIVFKTNGSDGTSSIPATERMRIDSSGNVGIGTASPSKKLTVQNGDIAMTNGYGLFLGSDENVSINSTSSTRVMRFNTGGLERARIDSSGNLLVGTTDINVYNGTSTGVAVTGSGYIFAGKSGDAPMYLNRISNDGTIANFSKDGSTVGSIGSVGSASDLYLSSNTFGARFFDSESAFIPTTSSGGTGGVADLGSSAYNWRDLYLSGGVITSSDYRLKDDIQPMQSYADTVKQMNLVNFAWKESGEREDGFIAHELQALVPSAVRGEKDAVGEDGNEQYQGVDPLKLIPVLTKALQEALERIETLENK